MIPKSKIFYFLLLFKFLKFNEYVNLYKKWKVNFIFIVKKIKDKDN